MEASQSLHRQLIISLGTHPSKTSLLTRYGHQSKFQYVSAENKQNIFDHIHSSMIDQNIILNDLPANINSYYEAEKCLQNHKVLVVYFKGEEEKVDESEAEIAKQYQKLGLLRLIDLKGSKNIDESYKTLKKRLLNKVIFVYGAPRSGKTELAHKIEASLGYKYVYFNDLKKQFYNGAEADEITTVNKLLKYLANTPENIVIDGFFKTKLALPILAEYLQPHRVFHLQSSNDQVQTFIHQIKDKQLKASKIAEFQNYLENKDSIGEVLKGKPFFQNIELGENLDKIVKQLKPTIIYLRLSDNDFNDQVAKAWDGTHLNLANLEKVHELRNKKGITKNSNIQEKVEYLKNLISYLNGRVVLSGFSDKLQEFIVFEKHIADITFYYQFNENELTYSEVVTPPMYYLGEQKLVRLDNNNQSVGLVLSYLDTRNPYILITGPETSGKTEIAKIIARDYGYTHLQFNQYMETYKEKYPPEGDEIPIPTIIAHFKQLFSDKTKKYILEGLPYEKNDLQLWIKQVGYPTSINLRLDNDKWLSRYRKKNQIDSEEVTEDDQEKITAVQQQNANYIKNLEEIYEKYPNVKLFQFDCNAPLISLENFLPLILRPRIFIVAENKSVSNILFLNIALKYNMTIFDLSNTDVRNIVPLLSNTSVQRDIVLYNYSSKDRLVSDDLYFIQNKIGSVRFVGVWGVEQKDFKDEKMVLERPVVEVKKKVVQEGQQNEQGGAAQQQPPAEQQLDEDGNPKKPKLDIYNFEWSLTGTAKNLSQWFINSKKPIKQFIFQEANKTQMYDDFELIINQLNRDRSTNIYTVIT